MQFLASHYDLKFCQVVGGTFYTSRNHGWVNPVETNFATPLTNKLCEQIFLFIIKEECTFDLLINGFWNMQDIRNGKEVSTTFYFFATDFENHH